MIWYDTSEIVNNVNQCEHTSIILIKNGALTE
jgi:hypothetical protein